MRLVGESDVVVEAEMTEEDQNDDESDSLNGQSDNGEQGDIDIHGFLVFFACIPAERNVKFNLLLPQNKT